MRATVEVPDYLVNDPKMYTKVKFAIDGEYDDNEIKTRLYGGCEKRLLCSAKCGHINARCLIVFFLVCRVDLPQKVTVPPQKDKSRYQVDAPSLIALSNCFGLFGDG